MFRSLAFKWMATLLLTTLIGVALVGVLAYRITITEFSRLREEQAAANFVADMTAYYERYGSWRGLANPPQGGDGRGAPPPRDTPRGFSEGDFFALADDRGVIVFGSGELRRGDKLSMGQLADGMPIIVAGQQVGAALLALPPPELDLREQSYIQGTNQALFLGALGAGLVALLVGGLLSRGFLRQVGELRQAIGAMQAGDLKQQVGVYSRDELGALAASFNQMSADLHRAQELRQQMTADIAHELRTPLTVISGYVEGLADGTFKPTSARFEAMQSEVHLLRRLVDDLRTLSLADAGELRLTKQPQSLAEMVQGVAQSFRALAEKQGVALDCQMAEGLPPVLLDRERMVQVLANLMANALRHTPAGGQVTLWAEHAGGGGVRLGVRDSGTGIAAEHLPNIFERFYRADPMRHSGTGQSGLGLAIAKSIVEAHGGTLHAESVPNQATTFTICLPAA